MKTIVFLSAFLVTAGAFSEALADEACFEVQNMTCATCPLTVKIAVKKLNGVSSVVASLRERNAIVEFDPKIVSKTEIQKAIGEVGYKAIPQDCKKNKD